MTPVRRLLGLLLAAALSGALVAGLLPQASAQARPRRCDAAAYAAHHPRVCHRTPPRHHRHLWSPHEATTFNYPFGSKHERYRIRHRVLTAIENARRGSKIRLATFTYVDKKMTSALIAARRRGVSVQLLVNRADVAKSPPFHRLRKAIGHRLYGGPKVSAADASFARTCDRSCRGVGGNLHSKIFLFSRVGHARWVSMVGSANLTTKAAEGQWNHMDTIIGRDTYVRLRHVFNQMKLDRVPRTPYRWFRTADMTTWVFPQPIPDPRRDPMVLALRAIGCHAPPHTGFAVHHPRKKAKHPRPRPKAHRRTSAVPRVAAPARTTARATAKPTAKPTPKPVVRRPWTRRTVIRIAMYAWFDSRGDYLAREVRRKWNSGCDVRVIYSVLNARVKKILYSPTGRGRIPMRRTVRKDRTGLVVDYNHSKYVAVSGAYNHQPRELVWSGSMNFTGLGVVSDDLIVRLPGRRTFRSYLTNFRRVWHSPKARKPRPTSPYARFAGEPDAPEDPQLGQGPLAHLEED